jgi:hypothetical protein
MIDLRNLEITMTPKTRISRRDSNDMGSSKGQQLRREWNNLDWLEHIWNAETGATLVDSRLEKRDLFGRSLLCFGIWEKLTKINSYIQYSGKWAFLISQFKLWLDRWIDRSDRSLFLKKRQRCKSNVSTRVQRPSRFDYWDDFAQIHRALSLASRCKNRVFSQCVFREHLSWAS